MAAFRLQFSLRSMLMAMVAVGFVTAEAAVFPNWIAGLAGIFGTITAAALATMMVIYGSSSERTVTIGALFPLGWMLLANQQETSFQYFYGFHAGFVSHWNRVGVQNRHAYVLGWLSAIFLGAVCLCFRRFLESCRGAPETEDESLDAPPNHD